MACTGGSAGWYRIARTSRRPGAVGRMTPAGPWLDRLSQAPLHPRATPLASGALCRYDRSISAGCLLGVRDGNHERENLPGRQAGRSGRVAWLGPADRRRPGLGILPPPPRKADKGARKVACPLTPRHGGQHRSPPHLNHNARGRRDGGRRTLGLPLSFADPWSSPTGEKYPVPFAPFRHPGDRVTGTPTRFPPLSALYGHAS